nr:periplasmic nitrate reductase, NapE protein [Pseudoxanthomonas sp.]
MTEHPEAGVTTPSRRRSEIIAFLVLAFGIWPIVAVGFVGSYGLVVWIWQMIFGPPGPPTGGH